MRHYVHQLTIKILSTYSIVFVGWASFSIRSCSFSGSFFWAWNSAKLLFSMSSTWSWSPIQTQLNELTWLVRKRLGKNLRRAVIYNRVQEMIPWTMKVKSQTLAQLSEHVRFLKNKNLDAKSVPEKFIVDTVTHPTLWLWYWKYFTCTKSF